MVAELSAAVIGGVAWNLLVEVPHLPRDLTTLRASGYRYGVGGTGAGKALNLAGLGVRTRFHGLVGEDEDGDQVRAVLRAAGVDLTDWPDPAGTERHLNLMDPAGERVSIFLNRSTADPDVTPNDLVGLTRGADLVFVSLTDYARRVLPPLAAAEVPVWVDLHDWDGGTDEFRRPFLEKGDFLVVSDVRLADPPVVAASLARDRELVVLTHGSRGATAYFPDREPLFVPPYDAGPAVDSNGAGDAFSVGTAYGRAQGWDWETALRAGSVVAGGCVTARHLADPRLSPAWLLERMGR